MYQPLNITILISALLFVLIGCQNDQGSTEDTGSVSILSSSSSSSSSTSSSGKPTSHQSSSKISSGSGLVSQHGQLKIENGTLVNANGNPVQLRGMSSLGLQWVHDAAPWMNIDSIRWLRDDWNTNVVRAAMYTENEGYIEDPGVTKKVWEVVDAAIALDMYVIVDWHTLSDCDPRQYQTEAMGFFTEVAKRYGETPNLIYEITNEPNSAPDCPEAPVTWSGHVKPYAEAVIPVIRKIDPDGLIIVGTPTWSQDVDVAARDPLSFSNVAYGFHFYACTHGQSLREKVNFALLKGAAIFSSEWGTTAADGSGSNCFGESDAWLDFFDENNISWLNWSLSVRQETSAALKPGASTTGNWTADDLTPSGKYVRNRLRQY